MDDCDTLHALCERRQELRVCKTLATPIQIISQPKRSNLPLLLHQAMDDHDTLYELCERWQELEQQRWTTAELQRRRARLALDYPGDDLGEEEVFGEQVSIIYGATTNKKGFKVPSREVAPACISCAEMRLVGCWDWPSAGLSEG